MILPGLAIALSTLFQSVYAWRTFFLLHSQEDYVEVARAKGLSAEAIERRYILRPTLPYLITSFALMMISFWQGTLALETLFDWPGVGAIMVQAIRVNDRGVSVGILTLFAYLLALTVFLLDIVYAIVDPRVKIGTEGLVLARHSRKGQPRRIGASQAATRLEREPNPPRHVFKPALPKESADLWQLLQKTGRAFSRVARGIASYPAVSIGVGIIVVMVVLSIFTIIFIPYDRAVDLWLGKGTFWVDNPKNALPIWVNLFRKEDLPETIIFDSPKERSSGMFRQRCARW
jgi:peptide/nickel transport system permease protein